MRLLPESNGVYKLNMKRKLKPLDRIKYLLIVISSLLIIGVVYQNIHDFTVGEKLKYRYDYTRVDGKKMDYVVSGSGDYTVVFDGDIGGDLSQWATLTERLNKESIRTFTYNRQGYGYSDNGSQLSPEEQAKKLKILLRKAGVLGKFILVGEGYGSLVMTNFANMYPESVEAMVLINPIDEATLSSKEVKSKYYFVKSRRAIEKLGSNIGLTNILDKLNLTVGLDGYENKIPDIFKEEFVEHRTMSSYTSAVYDEIDNIVNGTSISQNDGLIGDKPYYLITENPNDPLKKLSSPNSLYVHETTRVSNFMALDDEETVFNAITHIVKQLNMNKRFN